MTDPLCPGSTGSRTLKTADPESLFPRGDPGHLRGRPQALRRVSRPLGDGADNRDAGRHINDRPISTIPTLKPVVAWDLIEAARAASTSPRPRAAAMPLTITSGITR